MQRKRAEWAAQMGTIPLEKLVFLDESGINTDLARRYGRSIGKKRVLDSAPLNMPQTTTVLSAMRLDGQLACTVYEGGTTKPRFLDYLREVLLPELLKGDRVIMDNLSTHHSKGVEDMIRSVGAIPVYLPPYSPDLNPIEKCGQK